MTLALTAYAFEATTARLTGVTRAILLQTLYRADKRGYIRTSQTEIAQEVGVSRQTVAFCFTRLLCADILVKDPDKLGAYHFDLAMLDHDRLEDVLSPTGKGID
jgi:hypothetical protein